ncbi:Predicted arabinose efflux permease, MFS family [Actinokineospora alba]|uniref:Predicted arabinose efflux permease, MFS family n=1 Tax=Actinokineospora alba TaxID=504798 RepID=A0A1H0FBR8_9PSEU|nr:MFS transporter [Actinokineospora alba]TDP69418.1 putative MFS family arabinose efflux permease [Actinokineospora alba]SDI17198.1 Predicted arabinose efflux permease, MFS family [Actinokineospora alba]SDN92084.1 Predicted arabinose efflux permease, MFS family [Actinokineospora alba]
MPLSRLATLSARFIPADSLRRKLIAIRLAESIGKGVFISGSVVYFTLHVGLSAGQVGLGLSAAGFSGLLSSIAFGMVADRMNRRRLLSILFVTLAVGFSLYSLVDNVIAFYVLVMCVGFVEYGTSPTTSALLGTLVPPEERVRLKAMMRSVFNIGFSLGIGVAAAAALSPRLLVMIPLTTAVLMIAAAVLVTRLPEGEAKPIPSGLRRFAAVRDLPFLGVIGVSTVLASHVTIVLVTLPLWALTRTSMPHFVVPLLLIFNTVFVILFQVRASKGAETVLGASRIARRSGYWLAAGCLTVAVTALNSNVILVSGAIIAAVLVLSVAEIMQSASAWGLGFGLAPEHAQGEYLGAFDLHVISQNIIGPAILSGIVIAFGFWGWVAIAAVVLVASALIAPAARRSERKLAASSPEPAELSTVSA